MKYCINSGLAGLFRLMFNPGYLTVYVALTVYNNVATKTVWPLIHTLTGTFRA